MRAAFNQFIDEFTKRWFDRSSRNLPRRGDKAILGPNDRGGLQALLALLQVVLQSIRFRPSDLPKEKTL
jgi:hypothetical protein